LDALRRLRDWGLTAIRVVVAFHHRRVLSLMERRLRLDEMTPEASMESSRMALAALSTNELLKRIKGAMGKADYTIPVIMRLEQGYVSMVSPGPFSSTFALISLSQSVLLSIRRGYGGTEPPYLRSYKMRLIGVASVGYKATVEEGQGEKASP
jgi:hypothetical protein